MHFTHCKYCELNHSSVCNVFAIHTYPLCLQQRILYCNYFEIRARRNAMSTTLQDCFSCWSSVPWWDCYMSSLEANKILLTTWELGELLVGNNLLIRFSLFLFLQFVCKHLFFSPSVLFTDWNDSLIFRAFTASHYRQPSVIAKNQIWLGTYVTWSHFLSLSVCPVTIFMTQLFIFTSSKCSFSEYSLVVS